MNDNAKNIHTYQQHKNNALKQLKMTIEKTFEWLFTRIQQKQLKVCQFDIDCIKFLAEWVNRSKEKDLKENNLFAKIYTYALKNEFRYYQNIEIANSSLQKLLERPIEFHYNEMHKELNRVELELYSKNLGFVNKHPMLRTDKENEININVAKENSEELTKYVSGVYTMDEVYNNLNNQITEVINKYRNKP